MPPPGSRSISTSPSARPGTSSFTIDAAGIPLPEDVEVVSIEPSAITLELERLISDNIVPGSRMVEGVPAPGIHDRRSPDHLRSR